MPRVQYQGREVDGEDVSFTVLAEEWNRYQLHDGTEIRMRLVVTDVIKIPGESDQQGNPIYQVRSSNVVVVKLPDKR